MDNLKKTAEDLRLYGISYTRIHTDGRIERIPPMEMMVKKINAAQETGNLQSENHRLRINLSIENQTNERVGKALNAALQENERLKEALKDMVSIAEQHYPEELERQYEPRIQNAKKLIKADSQEQNRQ